MGLFTPALRLTAIVITVAIIGPGVLAQASPSIQIFMPDGSLPTRELRFNLTMDNGRVESFYTDSKGKFLLTRSLGLKPDSEYRITITGDGFSFGTTTQTFKEYSGVYYITVYLNPPASKPVPSPKVVDLAELDVKATPDAKQSYAEAMKSWEEGKREDAIRGLERAIDLYPDYFRALNDLGVIYMKLDRLDDAARMFDRASKLAPRVYYPRLNLGIIQTRRGNYKTAVSLLETLHKENQSVSPVRIALADALIALNRLDEAEPHLRTALLDLSLDKEVAGDAHYRLGLLLNKKHLYSAAVVELSLAAVALPHSARTRLQLGGALLQLKRLDDAERELTAAYTIGGVQMGGAQLMLGQIYFMEEKYEKALAAFEQYLSDVPAAPNAVEIQGVIGRIKKALSSR